jgi:hypothetical protein
MHSSNLADENRTGFAATKASLPREDKKPDTLDSLLSFS